MGKGGHFQLEHVQWRREGTFSRSIFNVEGKQGILSLGAWSVAKVSRVHFQLEHVQC
jgi:hypothetical protein